MMMIHAPEITSWLQDVSEAPRALIPFTTSADPIGSLPNAYETIEDSEKSMGASHTVKAQQSRSSEGISWQLC